ncbi:MAG: Endonuclease/Exonuclease/phosphatase family protein [Deltaproteobacteria bacterium ADurb.Bin510]|nr:MAG: Endonuclease/Exonuclease/phosphatase family protein [Deltaproteobacteria bacterium ADurb.Bin510]
MLKPYRHVVLMGDLNCEPGSEELRIFSGELGLHSSEQVEPTYPSWEPRARIDHILVSSEIAIAHCEVVDSKVSDHRPLAMEVILPAGLQTAVARAA